jgi:DNA-binding NarL/FixJ family response regulator
MSAAASRVLTGARNPEAALNRLAVSEYENLAIKPPKAEFSNGAKENDPAQESDVLGFSVSRPQQQVMTHAPILVREGLPIVLVIGQVDPQALVEVAESGVCAVLHRAEASADRLVRAIRAAALGHGDLPPELVRQLIDHVGESR